jgi:hypothetical protein
MKTKKATKQRKQIREFNIESELKGEFGELCSDDILVEEDWVLASIDIDDEE